MKRLTKSFIIIFIILSCIGLYFLSSWYLEKKEKENKIMQQKAEEEYIQNIEDKYGLTLKEIDHYVNYYLATCTQYHILMEDYDYEIDTSIEFNLIERYDEFTNKNLTEAAVEVLNYIFWDHPIDEAIIIYDEDEISRSKKHVIDTYNTEERKKESKELRTKTREILKDYGFNSKNRLTTEWVIENPYEAYHMIKKIPKDDWVLLEPFDWWLKHNPLPKEEKEEKMSLIFRRSIRDLYDKYIKDNKQ